MPKSTLLTLLLAIACVPTLSAQTTHPVPAWGDQGDGTYANPVLNADFSDPDVIRVDEKFYMVASDFHFMGMQVLESDDMVNWRYVSQIYRRFDEPGWDDNRHYAGGSWAPSIRYHDGRFYVYFCTPDEGLYMTSAPAASGPWEPLHLVCRVEKWEDPCPLWDDDGQAYLGRSQWGAGPIIVHKMSADGLRSCHNMLTQKVIGYVTESTTFLEARGDCFAGLACIGRQFRGVGITPEGIVVEHDNQRTLIRQGKFKRIYLRVQNDCLRHTHRFLYSLDGRTFLPAGEPFAMQGGYWKGIRVALFCYGNSGLARFDTFRRTDLPTSPEQ